MALTTTGGDASTFRQQGTMDWVALAQKPVQFSFNVLARYSKAGIDPLTVAAGQAACTPLKIPWKAQQEILGRMSKLPSVALYGDVAWFGFGLKHALFDLIDRDGGLECLTLCGCLAESFSNFYGAQVLHAFCRHQNIPSALLPGIHNWHALIKPCAGIFASSKFSNLIHGFACLLVPPSSFGMGSYEATAPDMLAQALIRLTQVSSKHLESITITGGIDCAWLAAFAEFVLGLRIEILTLDGIQEYCSSGRHTSPGGRIQVTFLKDRAAKTEIEITRKCFVLPVGRELFKTKADLVVLNKVNLIRSPWTSILIDSFGNSARILLLDPIISGDFGTILVYASQENAKVGVKRSSDDRTIPLKMQFCANSRYGDDLLDFAARRFPELKPVLQTAIANRKHRITSRMVKEAAHRLMLACRCSYCFHVAIDQGWCLADVMGTIVTMISILSMTNVHELNLLISGVQALCRRGTGHGVKTTHLHSAVRDLFSATNRIKPHNNVNPIAVAEDGICSFLELLTDPKLSPILAATVTVMSGHIECSGSSVEKIEDSLFDSDHDFPGPVPFELEPRKTFELLISETADFKTLQAGYRSQDNSPGLPCRFNVGEIFAALIGADQLIEGTKDTPNILGIDHEEKCLNQGSNNSNIPRVQKGQLCLMLASRGLLGEPILKVHKTSSNFSDQANHHQLYPEYQRLPRFPYGQLVYAGFTYVSDCPACIVLSLGDEIWGITDASGGHCSVTIHKSGQSPRHTNFEFTIREHISEKDDDIIIPISNLDDSHEADCENSHADHHGGLVRISHENDSKNNDENSREGNPENSHEDSHEDSEIQSSMTNSVISK